MYFSCTTALGVGYEILNCCLCKILFRFLNLLCFRLGRGGNHGFPLLFGGENGKMFEVVGALFSKFVQSFFFLSANSKPVSLGVSTAKLSQSDLHDLRLFFTFDEAETAGGACV